MQPAFDPAALRLIRTIDQVVSFLADELDWPIDAASLEDASFDFTPDELGIPADQVPKLGSLRQLRPLTTDQPWGIFFVEFLGPRLPVTALRRLLHALVTRKRARGDGTRRTWDLDDLLFVVTTDSGESVELHLVAFFDSGGPTAEIRPLAWRPSQSPPQHLRRLAQELLPRLAWPNESDVDQWRATWRDAFRLRHGEAIASAARLAERMAGTALALRERVVRVLTAEAGDGPFSDLLEDVRCELVSDVDDARFADMCAQTLVYGTLTSRITNPEAFGALPTLATIPLSNPFLIAFFEQVHDHTAEIDFGESGLETLAADLRETNVEAVLDQFGSTAKGGDPVIHFYEEFLAKYDRQMRADAGAFYTPQPVVRLIVATVDEIMRNTFGLEAGIADDATWSEVAERADVEVPAGVDPGSQFINMLDPATGTGTFLVEWLRRARTSYLAAQHMPDWAGHLRESVLPSMHAFEVMLAPYAIAHLKVALELEEHGEAVASTILLADALDHPSAVERLESFEDPVAREGQRAAALKRDARFTVVVGNPPYDREQRGVAAPAGARRKGGVVRYGVPGIEPLLEAVLAPLRDAGLGVHAKNVYNDYVYFWRYATWQATQRRPGPGVVAFITASSYLDGKSLGGLRHHLRDVFDELWIIDLGGEGRGAHVEENVFDIRTPVAIAIGVRHRGAKTCDVRYLRVGGSRDEKFEALKTLTLDAGRFERSGGATLDPFPPQSGSEYSTWPEITKLLPWVHSGSEVKRLWPIGPSRTELDRRWRTLVAAPSSDRPLLMKETRDRKVGTSVRPLLDGAGARLSPISQLRPGDAPERVARYAYRAFDRQWVLADNRIADYLRPDLWRIAGERQIYFTTLTTTRLGRGPAMVATPYVPDRHHFRGSYGAKDVIPLWRDAAGTVPNMPEGLVASLVEPLGDLTAEDLMAYVYALLGTAAFAERFAAELGAHVGPVHIPVTADPLIFRDTADLGRRLLHLHTWGERFGESVGAREPAIAREIVPVSGYPNSFSYDPTASELRVGSGRFGPVAPEVWQFEVSGLRPIRSWLGYRMANRRGKKSSPLDDLVPEKWTFSSELVELLDVLDVTVKLAPVAAELLERVVTGPLIDDALLPSPSAQEQKPPP